MEVGVVTKAGRRRAVLLLRHASCNERGDQRQGDTRAGAGARLLRRSRALQIARWVALAGCLLLLAGCAGNLHMSFLNPQGPVARAEAVHFYLVLGIMTVFVAGPIFLALPLLLWRYRYSNRKAVGYTPKWSDNLPINVLTWAGPVVIVCVLGFFVWRDSHNLDPYKPLVSSQPALQLQVIGYDWKWLFIYPDQHIATVGKLVVPVGRPVSFHLTSATVMKSFFIPALGSQIYAMGGMVTQLNLEASKTGRFLGENTMYDGNGFHDEKFTAVALSPDKFKAWVRQVKATGVPLNRRILAAIAQRTTREKLVTQLPQAAVRDGNVYLTGVTGTLFPRVVKAMQDDTSTVVPLADAARSRPDATATSASSRLGSVGLQPARIPSPFGRGCPEGAGEGTKVCGSGREAEGQPFISSHPHPALRATFSQREKGEIYEPARQHDRHDNGAAGDAAGDSQ